MAPSPYKTEHEMHQFRALGSLFRRTVAAEIATGHYDNLCSPNTKSKGSLPFYEARFRVNILPRPYDRTPTGERNLELGNTEIAVFLYGTLSGSEPQGLHLPEDEDTIRLILGRSIALHGLDNLIIRGIRNKRNGEYTSLSQGKVEPIVGHILTHIDDDIGTFKLAAQLFPQTEDNR